MERICVACGGRGVEEQVDPGLTLFADVVRQVGLQPALDLHRAARAPLAAAR